MIYYGKQTIDQADIKSVVDVLKGRYLTQGPMIFKFEDIAIFGMRANNQK